MALPPIVRISIQAAILSATSNLIAQVIKAYRTDSPFALDTSSIFNFVVFTLLNTPPNYLWQQFLEQTFPGYDVAPAVVETKKNDGEVTKEILPAKKLNVRNTATKFLLDQSLGAIFNTVVFLAGMAALKGADYDTILNTVKKDTLPLMKAGIKLWPMVSLLSFTVIPVNQRIVFGNIVGMAWGVFLSMMASGA